MMRHDPLPAQTVKFRRIIIDACWDNDRFGYVDADVFIGSCPVCGGPIGVHFARRAPRAVLTCHTGCTEREIAARIGDDVEAAP